jgi:hypothetical protein
MNVKGELYVGGDQQKWERWKERKLRGKEDWSTLHICVYVCVW